MVRMSNQATHLHIDKLNTPLSPLCARDKKRPEYSDLWADGKTILMGSRLTAIAVRERRDTKCVEAQSRAP